MLYLICRPTLNPPFLYRIKVSLPNRWGRLKKIHLRIEELSFPLSRLHRQWTVLRMLYVRISRSDLEIPGATAIYLYKDR